MTVCRRAKIQPLSSTSRLAKVGAVMCWKHGCSNCRNDGTSDMGFSLGHARSDLRHHRIVRENPVATKQA